MDINISEEYVAKRRREKSLREIGGSLRQRNQERRGGELWAALVRRIEERKAENSSGGSEKGGHDLLFGSFSA